LKQDNLIAFQNKIPIEALTMTFRDAITITKYLGLEYLWIDSLCIVQDDEDDWRREAALMCFVYGGSTINISASSATNGSMGCFQELKPRWNHEIQRGSGEPRSQLGCLPSSFRRSTMRSPLAKRGWVLQERVLSPRNLHFAEDDVFWECTQNMACENFPEELPSCFGNGFHFRDRPLKYTSWQELVERYTLCQSTFGQDKLIAISGIARRIQQENHDEYIAGLWRKDLELQLLWYVGGVPMPRYIPYVAPTWSWASIQTSVRHNPLWMGPDISTDRLVSVVDTKIAYASTDVLGEVKSAALRLSCTLFARVTMYQEDETWYLTDDMDIECTFDTIDTVSLTTIEVYLLPVIKQQKGTSITMFEGLMLEPSETSKDCYRRIGHFIQLNTNSTDGPDFQTFCENEARAPGGDEYSHVEEGVGLATIFNVDII
jgi:hypothetical protein